MKTWYGTERNAAVGEPRVRARWAGLLIAGAAVLVAGPSRADPPTPKNVGKMAQIPGGKFRMGSNSAAALGSEKPMHEVTVAAFQMDLTPVTVGAYRECVDAGVCTEAVGKPYGGSSGSTNCNWELKDHENYPVNCVTFGEAETYCKWVGKRLPSEEEWEYAAKGGDENRMYPWGSADPERDMPADQRQMSPHGCWGSILTNSCAVGSFPDARGKWGIEDLVGNVEQWTTGAQSDGYDLPQSKNPERHVTRGGYIAWGPNIQVVLRNTRRRTHANDDAPMPRAPNGEYVSTAGKGPYNGKNVGFRCVK